ncbi:hypothetical protein TI39_contig279g00064 [Zymoseptoria brevis]|uniref:DUF6604 domain-containing protein n=1 Tax=Zymoseptoria brevis TaxID=1047168 RepID=A0A0F4GZT2_9PEZI|nr:hypothetical protein TI39_contig279g00064 [Zymoseptoria brevis]
MSYGHRVQSRHHGWGAWIQGQPQEDERGIRDDQTHLGEFTYLAKVIAESTKPKIGLPFHIGSLLRNNEQKEQAAKEKGDAAHHHFITVLETVLSTLHAAQEPETQEADAPRSMENMFALLAVEEPSESPPSTSGKKAATKPSKSASTMQFQLEQTEEDAIFAIATFFKDVNAVRKNIQGVWKDYREDKVDVMSAAVTTDTAFTLLRHSCDSIQESVPGKPNFTEMVMTLQSYVGDTSDSGADFIEWTCILTAQKLEQFQEVHLLSDYMDSHQRARTLLDTLRRELDGEMLRYFGPNYIEDYSQLP